uniref:Uncharacterized protein n=1 Tax=Mycena chlorophos TaxID=658473 RepID=A0ABQ0LZV3_MYCCL|nr:predicted protein [Mycena chlorophos]
MQVAQPPDIGAEAAWGLRGGILDPPGSSMMLDESIVDGFGWSQNDEIGEEDMREVDSRLGVQSYAKTPSQ